jgi:hypothetical protein
LEAEKKRELHPVNNLCHSPFQKMILNSGPPSPIFILYTDKHTHRTAGFKEEKSKFVVGRRA